MNALASLPPWIALLVAVLVLGSALLAFIGSLGLLRLKSFYRRMHAPTLGTTLGLFLMIVANIVFFSLREGRLAVNTLLIGIFLTVTTPVTLMLLARAALARDRMEGATNVPPLPPVDADEAATHAAPGKKANRPDQ